MSQYKDYRRKAEQEARRLKKMLIEDGVLYALELCSLSPIYTTQTSIHPNTVTSCRTGVDVGEEGQAELDYEEETLYILVNETKVTVNNE